MIDVEQRTGKRKEWRGGFVWFGNKRTDVRPRDDEKMSYIRGPSSAQLARPRVINCHPGVPRNDPRARPTTNTFRSIYLHWLRANNNYTERTG